MKFSSGVDGLSKENQFLRTLTKNLLLIIASLFGLVLFFSNKEPIIVERNYHGLEVLKRVPLARTESDLQQAVTLMIKARFDSDTIAPHVFLNPKQLLLRETEQKDLKAQNMNQKIILRVVTITKDKALVELDRVISVGELRSALKAKVKLSFEETEPTEINPYGLTLSLADPIQSKEEKK
jgi:hypothetical protein